MVDLRNVLMSKGEIDKLLLEKINSSKYTMSLKLDRMDKELRKLKEELSCVIKDLKAIKDFLSGAKWEKIIKWNK